MKKFLVVVLMVAMLLLCCSCDLFKERSEGILDEKESSISNDSNIVCADGIQNKIFEPHLISQSDRELSPFRYLRDAQTTKTGSVFFTKKIANNDEELYLAISNGYKPIPPKGSSCEDLLNKIYEVLDNILTNDMTEYQKVHAIYDWLIYCVEYDYAMLEQFYQDKSIVSGDEDCFRLWGVFENRKAVCDAYAKAFEVMCKIEGISCYRIIGTSQDVGHAWNKVYIHSSENSDCMNEHSESCDEDHKECNQINCTDVSHRRWFFVDSTWGNMAVLSNGKKTEWLSHQYFLRADEEVKNSHSAKYPNAYNNPPAHINYDYYEIPIYVDENEQNKIDLKITGEQELENLFNYAIENKLKGIEFFVDFRSYLDGSNILKYVRDAIISQNNVSIISLRYDENDLIYGVIHIQINYN